nr:iron-sulfur cluster-binding domain-containing protein [Oculatellaceae cyanobacterium Prado106]
DRPAPKLLFLSAGSGITPMMSMSRWLTDTLSGSDIIFYHCARTPADIIFRQELELMSARYPNFHLALSITRPEPGHPWYGFTGRLTADLLRAIAPDFQERTVYVCGPEGFMQATKTLLLEQQFPPQNYHEESFGAPKKRKPAPASSPVPTPTPAASGHSVMFSQSDRAIASDGSESILELAEQANVKIRSNCRQGVCGACKKRKLEGQVRYDTEPDALDPEDQAKGYILTCVACPIGRVVIEA